jgi:hypothetical protein
MSLTTISSGDNIMITASNNSYGSTNTINTVSSAGTFSTVNVNQAPVEYILDKYDMNQLTVYHKVASHELLKIKEMDVNYGDVIKSNLTKSIAENITKRMSFTKKNDIDMDATTFYGRVWVFTKDELEELIKDARNA